MTEMIQLSVKLFPALLGGGAQVVSLAAKRAAFLATQSISATCHYTLRAKNKAVDRRLHLMIVVGSDITLKLQLSGRGASASVRGRTLPMRAMVRTKHRHVWLYARRVTAKRTRTNWLVSPPETWPNMIL